MLPFMILVIAAIGAGVAFVLLNQTRLAIKQGPKCETCPLYKAACQDRSEIADSFETSIPATTSSARIVH